jgi:hypothetical protein
VFQSENVWSRENVEKLMNQEGSQGWEIAAMIPATSGNKLVKFMVVYKRPTDLEDPSAETGAEQLKEAMKAYERKAP